MKTETRPTCRFVRAAWLLALALAWVGAAAPAAEAEAAPEPFKGLYEGYKPDFLDDVWHGRVFGRWRASEKEMRLSSEPTFFTLNLIHEDARANALVRAAREKELEGRYRDALKMYQIVIDRYPHQLYRVSKYGVFVPVAQYCQRRILNFPPEPLGHYRTLHDARAREAFESARSKNSLIGLSEVVDTMLATSYGGRAIAELGNAGLDSGHYLAALERYQTIRAFFPPPELRTPELELKTAVAAKMLGRDFKPKEAPLDSALTEAQLDRLRKVYAGAQPQRKPFHSQKISPPHATANDYTLLPPTVDPLAFQDPAWSRVLPGSRRDRFVYSQPVVTQNSVIYRHKNIVYCHSILNGELRWTNDLGGRAVWQNGRERQYPQEDVLVQDGLVFTVIAKGGPSLVALDEVTGQLKWAYGPMVAVTQTEARMRFLAAPTGGPRTIYAGYILDNIEGETHVDTEYGLIAFESATGRIRWRTPLCRLAPGKFAAGFAVRRRNRIRSFASPPLYHQGTVYYGTNAGAVAAVDALSGRTNWLMRYQYAPGIHDATRPWRGHRLWYNQRPLIVGERLYVLPVDSPFFLCLDRRTGKVRWSVPKPGRREAFFLGPMRTGELVFVYSGRGTSRMFHTGGSSTPAVHVFDPETGKVAWQFKDLMPHIETPVLRNYIFGSPAWCAINRRWTNTPARPCLTQDDKLYVMTHCETSVYYRPGMLVYNLTELDLNERKITNYRRYYTGELLAHCAAVARGNGRESAPRELAALEDLPHKSDQVKHRIRVMKEMIDGALPENEHGPFRPFSRVTVRRYGGRPFELRFGPRTVSMVYDREAVLKGLAGRRDAAAEFARAELAIGRSRLAEAAALLKQCLRTISSEDLDFRALINQQLYKVHKRLCRSAIRSNDRDAELENALGMARTAGTLAEEIETLFALSEAYDRRGDPAAAARCLRSIIETYGHHEYPVASAVVYEQERLARTARTVLENAERYSHNPFYGAAFGRGLALTGKGLPLYFSTVSPLPKDLTVRAGELAARRLDRLRQASEDFAERFGRTAREELVGRPPDEQFYRLWQFPGTPATQAVLNDLFDRAAKAEGSGARRRMWELADAARVARLSVPEKYRGRVTAPGGETAAVPLDLPQKPREHDLAEEQGINWLVLERRGDRAAHPNLLFLGGRVRKRLDNKFVLTCFDLTTGKKVWEKRRIRLKGKGQEPGFFHAFVHADLVVVHGLYDVLAYDVKTAELRWRHRVPFDFEIKHAVMSGDLLVLAGATETIALHIPTRSPAGGVVWQVKERGDLYVPPYFHGDRLVSLRKMPFNLTVRFRATGKLIGRLDLPDLSLVTRHPLLEKGPEALPAAIDGRCLAVTDGWYYILVDVERMQVVWKRLIDNNDLTREPAMRFALGGEYLAVLKEDYDQKALYMLSSETGRVLWHTDPKNAESPQPMHSMFIADNRLYGIGPHAGQRFYFVARDCATGKLAVNRLVKDYAARPKVRLVPRLYGGQAVVEVQDRKTFELRAFAAATGEPLYTLGKKGAGEFGVHGRVSATVQAGRAVLLSKDDLGL
jgi:outer membrane protein assembly factor BamB